MGNSIFGIAVSGLHTAQAGLMTTSHNIANVNTPGYSRQETLQATTLPTFYGSGYFGSGVAVDTVRRLYDGFLEGQVRATTSEAAASDTLATQLAAIDNLLADPAAGLSPALDAFFSGLNGVAAQPADAAARQTAIARADALAARFRDLDARLSALRVGANRQIETAVGTANTLAARIADLNQRIADTGGAGGSTHAPNDLLDQRDRLLRDLSGLVGASVVAVGDGSVNVFLGGRLPLVIGAQPYELQTFADPESPRDIAVGSSGSGVTYALEAVDAGGGELGGLLAFRDEHLTATRNALGRVALALASEMNLQHQLGQDRAGAAGGALFAAGTSSATSRSTNAGTAQLGVTITDFSALGTSNYRVDYDGSAYAVTRLSDGVSQSYASLPQTFDGISLSLASGTPAAGDRFIVEPTAAGATGFTMLVRDPAKIAAAAPIATSSAAGNTGAGRISAGSVNPVLPLNANLRQTVTITFTAAGTFDVSGTGTGNPTGVAYTDGATISYNGWSVAISGTPAAGDVFTVSANAGGVADSRNAARLAGLQSARTLEGGTASYGDAYALMVADTGNRSHAAEVTRDAQAALATQTQMQQQSVSGVNLDEEAANLLRYQQAYQAASKALAIANTLFDSLLEISR